MHERYCPDCQRTHRLMESCPHAPGFWALWRMWVDGERSDPAVLLAVIGTLMLAFVFSFGVSAMIGAG